MVLPDPQPTTAYSKSFRNYVTAHKISLLVLLKEYCYVKHHNIRKRINQVLTDEVSWEHNREQNRDFSSTYLKLIQNPDVDLQSLINIIHPIMHPKTYRLFICRLNTIRKNGIAALLDFFGTLDSLLIEAAPLVPVIQKSSVLGLFVRHMLLAFDKLTFSLQTKLCRKFHSYFDAAFEPTPIVIKIVDEDEDDMREEEEEDEENSSDEFEVLASQRQAEFFIAQQAALLQVNESETLSPIELQEKINELVKGNPELHEGCYLSYMNSMRVKEYCGAKESLFRHYDRNTAVPQDCKSSSPSDDLTRSSRYAALNLAIMHAMFGHKEQALAALNEAIMLAQEVNDNICLQFALVWLYRLTDETDEDKEVMIERSIAKAIELGLFSLSSLGIQSLAKLKSETTEQPTSVLETLGRSDIQNCQHSMTDMMGPAYMMRSGLWTYYGNSQMGLLLTLGLLNLNTSDPTYLGVCHVGEGVCLALKFIAHWISAQGYYLESAKLLILAQELFPPDTAFSHIWQVTEQTILYDKAFYRGKWNLALQATEGIAIFNKNEAHLRRAQLFLHQGNIHKADIILKKLMEKLESGHVSPHFYCRALLLQAELLIETPNKALAMPVLMNCLAICKAHHLLGLECLTTIQIAERQLELNLPSQAWHLLTVITVPLMAHGTFHDKGVCFYICARCVVKQAFKHIPYDYHRARKAMLGSLRYIDQALWYMYRIQAVRKMKKMLAFKAYLFNYLEMPEFRNREAYKCRYVEDEFINC